MSPELVGGILGLCLATGVALVGAEILRGRRPTLQDRVAPFLLDLPTATRTITQKPMSAGTGTAAWAVFGPSVQRLAEGVERVLGGSASVRRRLDRLGGGVSLDQFRVSQVLWGLSGFASVAALGLLRSLQSSVPVLGLLLACSLGFIGGVLVREQALTGAVRRCEERKLAEFPTVADLLALSVAAGEGPVAALERVVAVSHGELSRDLSRLLGDVRTGTPVARALDDYAGRTGVPVIARFAEGLAVALERGTPLVDILHSQAADVREAGRRQLIETGARKEVLMMAPVVFLILPVTVVFAFYPGVIGLNLTSP